MSDSMDRDVTIFVIGVIHLPNGIELRCVREPWGWRPDIMVNMTTEEVKHPPECFVLDDDTIAALDAAWDKAKETQ